MRKVNTSSVCVKFIPEGPSPPGFVTVASRATKLFSVFFKCRFYVKIRSNCDRDVLAFSRCPQSKNALVQSQLIWIFLAGLSFPQTQNETKYENE